MKKIWIWVTCGILALGFIVAFLLGTGDEAPAMTPKIPTPSPTPITLLPNPEWLETHFSEPLVYEDLDILPNIKTDTYPNTTCIVYSNGEVCYIPEKCYKYEKSQDGQKAVILASSGNIWFVDTHGTKLLSQDASNFSLTCDGTYLYFTAFNTLFGYDPQTTIVETLYKSETNFSFMTASPAGNYCVFSVTPGELRILAQKSGIITTFSSDSEINISSVATISEDGQWIYGYSPEMGFTRISTTNKTFTQLFPATNMISKLYFNKDATECYYEYQNSLYFCAKGKNPTKVLDVKDSWWQLLSQQPKDLYKRNYLYIHDMFFYDGAFDQQPFIYKNSALYVLNRNSNNISLEPYIDNVLWHNDFSFISKDSLPKRISDDFKEILAYSHDILLYVDLSFKLQAYNMRTNKIIFTMREADVDRFAFSRDGDFYYITPSGILMKYAFDNNEHVKLNDFSVNWHYLFALLVEQDGDIYIQDFRTEDTKIYFVSTEEPYLIYLGEEA